MCIHVYIFRVLLCVCVSKVHWDLFKDECKKRWRYKQKLEPTPWFVTVSKGDEEI